MTSTWLVMVLIGLYAVIALAAGCERNWPRCWYFVGSIVITAAVVWMDRRG